METRMQLVPDTTPHSDSVKKPYKAPELVVMGNAAAMTQSGDGALTDAIVAGASNAGS